MKAKVTAWIACLCMSIALTTQAQPVRNGQDVTWARDVDGAELTLDGALDEEAWQQADSIILRWENPTYYAPGGGWDPFFNNFNADTEPTDPVDAVVKLLRDGNTLWIGVEANDQSVGGAPIDFWTGDGLIMSILDKRNRSTQTDTLLNFFNGANTDEFFFTWFNADTTAGSLPNLFGNEGDDRDLWDGVTVVHGTSNDDSDTDEGYTQELWIDLSTLGYDMTAAEGDRVPMTFAVFDFDYKRDPDGRQFLSRAWWQNGWGGDMPMGVGFVHGQPGVTVGSGAAPDLTEPELRLPTASDEITLDGSLDEEVWSLLEPQVTLKYQMTNEMLDALPGFGPYYTHWFRPGGDAEGAPPVVDASTGQIRMFFQGSMLYVGLDTDDQAINGKTDEASADGIRFVLRQPDTETPGTARPAWQFMVVVDSTGSAALLEDAARPDTVEAAVSLKGASTAGDASDIDEGYSIELAIDLSLLGFPADLSDEVIYIGANYFDGDDLESEADSYGMRTWWLTERASGPMAQTYLDPDLTVTDVEAGPMELPQSIELEGNYPNPFNPSTTLRYALPQTGQVTVEVYDVLGRRVMMLAPGLQQAGSNELTIDAATLSSGVYFYRISVAGDRDVRSSAVGRMMLLK